MFRSNENAVDALDDNAVNDIIRQDEGDENDLVGVKESDVVPDSNKDELNDKHNAYSKNQEQSVDANTYYVQHSTSIENSRQSIYRPDQVLQESQKESKIGNELEGKKESEQLHNIEGFVLNTTVDYDAVSCISLILITISFSV